MLFDVFSHQDKFIKTREKFPALVAGYGSGKTLAFCLKGILELGRNPGKTILLAEPVFPMIRDVLQPTLEQLLNDLKFRYQYRASESKYNIYWKNGSGCIILRSAENWRRWAGLNRLPAMQFPAPKPLAPMFFSGDVDEWGGREF